MPMQSQAQRGYLHANLPKVAAKFEAETPDGKKLPYKKASHLKSRVAKRRQPTLETF